MNKQCCFGVDIGGTKIAVTAGAEREQEIEILERTCFPTIPQDPEANLEKIVGALEAFQAAYGKPSAIGISCGGPLDAARGVILGPPNLPGWDCVPITARLEALFGVPAFLENDANACALAEFHYGAGRGTENMVFLTFGTGLGAGLILNGALYRGATDTAGEVGHIRLQKDGPVGFHKAGSFEGFCSGGGIRQLGQMYIEKHQKAGAVTPWARAHAGDEALSAKEIARAAYDGDKIAREIMAVCGRKFGEGLSILIDILNPERIVAGSIFARSGDLLIPEMEKAIAEEALPLNAKSCQIVPAQLGERIGDYASLSVAFSRLRGPKNGGSQK